MNCTSDRRMDRALRRLFLSVIAVVAIAMLCSGCGAAKEIKLFAPSTGSPYGVNLYEREVVFPETLTINMVVPPQPAFHPVDGGSISASGDTPAALPPLTLNLVYNEATVTQTATATDGGGGGLGNEVRPTVPVTTPNSETPTEPTPGSTSSTEPLTPEAPVSSGTSGPEAG